MSKVSASYECQAAPEKDLPRFLTLFGEQVSRALNNGLDFETNFNSKSVSVLMTFSSANTDSSVAHGHCRVPVGYIIIGLSGTLTVYDGVGANTATNLFLRASATGTSRLLVY